MTDRLCSECGRILEPVKYGECGPHVASEFVQEWGYKVDGGDMYGDWDYGGPFIIPRDRLTVLQKVWTTKEQCCYYPDEPDMDDEDYCVYCKDVMEPAGT